ncbi:MAG: N-acetylmuramoyl-L-alanine amidase [Hydrogenophilaceae bacterium]|nr:N-acetylmuramoyl-L-alanine amidase [Hydrogenophilaceae bacterium]
MKPLLLLALAWACAWAAVAQAAVGVKAVRLWPSADYSRIAIELSEEIGFKQFQLKNPERIVLDLEGVEPEAALTEISGRIGAQDPYIAGVRVARNRPGVTRMVIDLKQESRPQIFTLKPFGEYGHRLVLDVYPVAAPPTLDKQVESAIAQAEQDAKPADKAVPAKTGKNDMVRLVTVAIDAGHGGEDPGALGANGSREKDVTLAVARRLKAQIDRQPNMRAYLTRDGDYFIPLHERVNKARRAQADLFVSIHADAFVRPDARGSSVFALSEKGATSAAARWLAKRENDADLIGGINIDVKDVYLKQTLLDLSQTATIADSIKLGRAVLDELGEVNALHKPHVEQAGFAVLKAPDIPSILVETAFISNPEEARRLTDDDYQDKLAAAIATGIKSYFDRNPPLARTRVVQSF